MKYFIICLFAAFITQAMEFPEIEEAKLSESNPSVSKYEQDSERSQFIHSNNNRKQMEEDAFNLSIPRPTAMVESAFESQLVNIKTSILKSLEKAKFDSDEVEAWAKLMSWEKTLALDTQTLLKRVAMDMARLTSDLIDKTNGKMTNPIYHADLENAIKLMATKNERHYRNLCCGVGVACGLTVLSYAPILYLILQGHL